MTGNQGLHRILAVLTIVMVAACQVQWVAPYSAELQTRATDMLAQVVAWEDHMRAAAGTAAADPRDPEVQATLDKWHGEIEAMGEIELGIDPGSTVCDKFLATISGSIASGLKQALPQTPTAGSSAAKPIAHCETLPSIFTRMMQQVTGDSAQTPGIPFILDQQCRLPWLSEEYFAAPRERGATAGASSPARPTIEAGRPGTPSADQKATARQRCLGLFERRSGAAHGVLVNQLVVDLDAIIYREGRQAATSAK